jgi:RNA polymerase subunit RPABC4/transcription elongation factor Spt4
VSTFTFFASAFGSVHDLYTSTAFDVARNLVLFLAVVFWLGLAGWVFRDARRRLDDRLLVATATLLGLVVPYVGPVIYMLFRPPETLAEIRVRDLEVRALEEEIGSHALHCPVCRAEVEADYRLCPVCTTRLKAACAHCSAPLDPAWQVCPYCASSTLDPPPATVVLPTLVTTDLDAALTAEAAGVGSTAAPRRSRSRKTRAV